MTLYTFLVDASLEKYYLKGRYLMFDSADKFVLKGGGPEENRNISNKQIHLKQKRAWSSEHIHKFRF